MTKAEALEQALLELDRLDDERRNLVEVLEGARASLPAISPENREYEAALQDLESSGRFDESALASFRDSQERWQRAGLELIVDIESAWELLPLLNRKRDVLARRIEELKQATEIERRGSAKEVFRRHDQRVQKAPRRNPRRRAPMP